MVSMTQMELVDHTPATIAIEETGNVVEETSEWTQECDSMKRVKVRTLLLQCFLSPFLIYGQGV